MEINRQFALVIQEMTGKYAEKFPHVQHMAIRLTVEAEDALRTLYPRSKLQTSEQFRNELEQAMDTERPSGIQILIWNQEYVDLCFPKRKLECN